MGASSRTGYRFTMLVLQREYDINISVNTSTRYTGSKSHLAVRQEGVDAAWGFGEQSGDVKSVFYPLQEMESKFGSSGWSTFFIVNRNQVENLDTAFALMESFRESARKAQDASDEFRRDYPQSAYWLVDDGEMFTTMTPEFRAASQYIFDTAYDQGAIDSPVNLSSKLVRR